MAGYSGTPLPKKLGIKPGTRLGSGRCPGGLRRDAGRPPRRRLATPGRPRQNQFDVIVCFARSSKELARDLPALPARLNPGGGLWIAWPKKSAQKSAASPPI